MRQRVAVRHSCMLGAGLVSIGLRPRLPSRIRKTLSRSLLLNSIRLSHQSPDLWRFICQIHAVSGADLVSASVSTTLRYRCTTVVERDVLVVANKAVEWAAGRNREGGGGARARSAPVNSPLIARTLRAGSRCLHDQPRRSDLVDCSRSVPFAGTEPASRLEIASTAGGITGGNRLNRLESKQWRGC